MRRAVAVQWDYEGPSHRQRWPLVSVTFANQFWIYNRYLHISRVVPALFSVTGVSSPVELHSLGRMYGRPAVVQAASLPPPPLSTQLADPRERQVSIQLGHQRRRRSCRNDDVLSNRLWDSSSLFSVGVYSPSRSQEWVYGKAAVVSTQIYRRVLGRAHSKFSRNRGYHEKVLLWTQ